MSTVPGGQAGGRSCARGMSTVPGGQARWGRGAVRSGPLGDRGPPLRQGHIQGEGVQGVVDPGVPAAVAVEKDAVGADAPRGALVGTAQALGDLLQVMADGPAVAQGDGSRSGEAQPVACQVPVAAQGLQGCLAGGDPRGQALVQGQGPGARTRGQGQAVTGVEGARRRVQADLQCVADQRRAPGPGRDPRPGPGSGSRANASVRNLILSGKVIARALGTDYRSECMRGIMWPARALYQRHPQRGSLCPTLSARPVRPSGPLLVALSLSFAAQVQAHTEPEGSSAAQRSRPGRRAGAGRDPRYSDRRGGHDDPGRPQRAHR